MSADEQSMRRVTAIRNGTVIDHIPGGMVLQALQIFNVDGRHSNPISLVMNVPSRKLGTKDILKIEDRELSESESQKLALLSPGSHVNIIRNFVVAEKNVAELPKTISDMALCPNENCISNNERGAKTKFNIIKGNPLSIQCVYCGRKIAQNKIIFI